MAATPNAMRSFDPRKVGSLECEAWVAYYRRRWVTFLWAAIGLTRETFRLPWRETLRGAWWVLRANQLWAPYPNNDPGACRAYMRRFYALVARVHGERFDLDEAARLEVEWWRVHREHQHDESGGDATPLARALAALYAHVYGVPEQDVLPAGEQRALAMDISDRWIEQGCDPDSPLIPKERAALVRSYAALLAAVHQAD